jgi:hypothetical protein
MKKLLAAAVLALAFTSPAKAQYAPIGADSGSTNQVSVGTTATLIVAARTGGPRVGRVVVVITNTTGSDKLCLGFTAAVTPTTGECLPPIAGSSITLSSSAAIYGIVPTTVQTVGFLELF